MPIRTIPIAEENLKLIGLSVQEKLDSDRVQKVKDGVPQWSVECLATDVYGSSDIFRVTITAITRPELTPHTPVAFVGLRVGAWSNGNGASFYYQADGVRALRGNDK